MKTMNASVNHKKDAEPLFTINRIRNILESLSIFLTETNYISENQQFYSSRIKIDGNDLGPLNIGTNGKGMSPELSLASAYGEFMERLQNQGLFINTHYLRENLGFIYSSDERFLKVDNLYERVPHVFKNLFHTDIVNLKEVLQAEFSDKLLLCVPFYSVNSDRTELLPLSLISHFCSTNGMCSGNTYSEAITQGLSEIIERFVIKQIYIHKITPPDIPKEYFQETTIFERIKSLESSLGYKIIIKDCSLGQKFPVIGTLIINQETMKYRFKLGADPNPHIALERCMTEIYQGNTHNPMTCDFSLTIDPCKSLPETIFNYYKTVIDGSGYYPKSIFAQKPTYDFDGYYLNQAHNSTEEVQNLTQFLLSKGYHIYIRDNSFLGFPAFYVYIPGMSELNYIFSNTTDRIKSMKIYNGIDSLLRIKSLNYEELAALEKVIMTIENSEMSLSSFDPRNYFLYNTSDALEDLLPDIFKVMLYYKLGNIKKSYFAICHFIDKIPDRKRTEFSYYFAVRSYLKMLMDECPSEIIEKQMCFYHGRELGQEIIKDFADSQNIFQYFPLPNCFHCSECEISKDCKYFQVMEIVKRVKMKNKENLISQQKLSQLFGSY